MPDVTKDIDFLFAQGHEIRNHLASITNAMAMLDEELPNSQLVKRVIGLVGRHTKLLAMSVDDILDLSAIQKGVLDLDLQVIDAKKIFRDVTIIVQELMRAKQHAFAAHVTREQVYIRCDAQRTSKILVNLLANAAKYTEPHGKITFLAESKDGNLVIKIRDNGPGLGLGKFAKISDFLASKFGKRNVQEEASNSGVGKGLFLAEQLTILQGGTISLGYPERGTEVILTFPLTSPLVQDLPKDTGKKNIVLVEDDTDISNTLAALIKSWGHSLEVCYLGEKGVENILQQKPDLALIDLGLPDINGYEVAKRIREQDQKIMLVAMSGYSDSKRAKAAGFNHLLVKPVQTDDLQAFLRTI